MVGKYQIEITEHKNASITHKNEHLNMLRKADHHTKRTLSEIMTTVKAHGGGSRGKEKK